MVRREDIDTVLFEGPLNSISGYGERSRNLYYCIDDLFDDADVLKEVNSWRGFLDQEYDYSTDPTPEDVDLYFQCSLPGEFQRKGKFNIGFTAGTEVDRIPFQWIQKCNVMDAVVLSSTFSKKVFESSEIELNVDNGSRRISVNKPLYKFGEYVDTSIYSCEAPKTLKSVEEDTVFLSIGTWEEMRRGYSRKGLTELVEIFYRSFADTGEDVALILKIQGGFNSREKRSTLEDKVRQIKDSFDFDEYPPIYLVQGVLNKAELAGIYSQADFYVLPSKGEGFGRTFLESLCCGTPVIAPGVTGHIDFLNKNNSLLIEANSSNVPKEVIKNTHYPKGSKWQVPNYQDLQLSLTVASKKGDSLFESFDFNPNDYSLDKQKQDFKDLWNEIKTDLK